VATGRNRPFGWNAAAARYVDAQGRFVSKASVRAAIDGALDNASAVMAQATEALRMRAITVTQWHTIMRREVKNVHLYSAAAAKGGWAQLTPQDLGYLGQRIRQELGYLDRFARQLRNPRFPRDGRVTARARMYAQAGRYTYHRVDRQVQLGIGMTHERNILSAGEACESCIEQADLEWVPIGTLVPVGNRQCLTNCRCDIAYKKMEGEEGQFAVGPDESRERPKPGTVAAQVWDLADELSRTLGRKATRQEVVEAAVGRGIKASTASARYGRWARTYDATVTPPVPPPPTGLKPTPLSMRPKPGSVARRVWDIAEDITAELGRRATRQEVVRVAARMGINPSTASARYGRWARTHDAVNRGGPIPVPRRRNRPPTPDNPPARVRGGPPEPTGPRHGAPGSPERIAYVEKRLSTISDELMRAEEEARAALSKARERLYEVRATRIGPGLTMKARQELLQAAYAELADAKRAIYLRRMEVFRAPNPGSKPVVKIARGPSRRRLGEAAVVEWKADIELGGRFVMEVVDEAFHPAQVAQARYTSGRAYHRIGTVYTSWNDGPSVVAHEIVHWIEKQNPQILRQALEFRARRTVGEAPVALRKLRPGIRYRADEFALKDRFDNPYSGKLYRSGGVDEATEILTMGVQLLMEDPVRFYTVDRDYFEFILRAIWGALP